MAKKSRRQRRQASTRKQPKSTEVAEQQEEAAVKADLSEEYRYVIEDLARIGIIAAILIASLVVLSFFL